MAIPASNLVEITPRVLSGTGSDLTFNGLFLTENSNLPSNTLMPFYSASEVSAFFGAGSDEYQAASVYFGGFDNSDTKPAMLYFFKHATTPTAAFVRSGTFDETQAQILADIANIVRGTFSFNVNGTAVSIQNIDFSGVTSLSAAAAILQQAIRDADISDIAASNAYATAVLPGVAGNALSIRIETAEDEQVRPAVAASSAIGTAVTAGADGNNISVSVAQGTPEITPAVAATSEIGTAVTAGQAGNAITVEVTEDTETVSPAVAASCKYGTAKTAGAAGNNLKVVITGSTGAWAIKINDGSSDVYTKDAYTADTITATELENDYIAFTDGVALAAEEVQLTGGADLTSKTVYDVVTKVNGTAEDTQDNLETPSELTDNAYVTFNKSGSFSAQTYTFTGGTDEVRVERYNVETLYNNERRDMQENLKTPAELTDNELVAFNKEGNFSAQIYTFTGGSDAVYEGTYTVYTLQDGAIVAQQTSVNGPYELENNSYVTFNKTQQLVPGEYPLTGGRDMGAQAVHGATVEYASNLNAFTFTAGTTGAATSITGCAGTAADAFYLTADKGATYSEGADVRTYTESMNAAAVQGQNWVTFSTIAKLNTEEIIELAQWSNVRYTAGTQFLFVFADDDPNLLSTTTTSQTAAAQLQELNINGVCGIYGDLRYAAFIMGAIASIAWDRANSVLTLAFKSQAGLGANVQDESAASALESAKMNFVGNYASRNDAFIILYPGSMFGQWSWIDSYINSTWLSNALQVQIMAGLQTAKRVPYNDAGYTLIRAWCSDVIERAITNGVISPNVNLSQTQKTELQQEAGLDISNELYSNGYYLQILDADATVRQQRRSPACSLWYTDAGSVHRISMPVVAIQ